MDHQNAIFCQDVRNLQEQFFQYRLVGGFNHYIISKTKFFERGNQKTDCFIKIRENVKGQKNYLGIRSLYSKNYYLSSGYAYRFL